MGFKIFCQNQIHCIYLFHRLFFISFSLSCFHFLSYIHFFLFSNRFNLTFPPRHWRYFKEASCLIHHGYSFAYLHIAVIKAVSLSVLIQMVISQANGLFYQVPGTPVFAILKAILRKITCTNRIALHILMFLKLDLLK